MRLAMAVDIPTIERAKLRRSTVEEAAAEMIRIGLYQTRDQGQSLPEGLDVTDDGDAALKISGNGGRSSDARDEREA
jgi:hypothetical protein